MSNDAFHLNQMSPPPKRRSGWVIALIAGALLILGTTGAILSNIDTEPAAKNLPGPGTPNAAGQVTPTSAGAHDKYGAKACAAVRASNDGPSPFTQEPAAMAAIATDGQLSINPFIRGASEELEKSARAAVDARGTADEPIQGIKMGTAALNLETACIEQWYYPPAR